MDKQQSYREQAQNADGKFPANFLVLAKAAGYDADPHSQPACQDRPPAAQYYYTAKNHKGKKIAYNTVTVVGG